MSRRPPFPWSRCRPRLPAPLGTNDAMTGQEGGHCSIGRMQRLARWVAGAVGGIAAYRLLRRRPRGVLEHSPEPGPAEPDVRVEELRAKLAESRSAEPVVETVVEDAP